MKLNGSFSVSVAAGQKGSLLITQGGEAEAKAATKQRQRHCMQEWFIPKNFPKNRALVRKQLQLDSNSSETMSP